MENKFFIEATYTPLMAIMGVSPLQIAGKNKGGFICPAMIGIENMQNPNRFFIHSSEMLWEDFLREYIKIFAEGE